jgi:hypothetical protein
MQQPPSAVYEGTLQIDTGAVEIIAYFSAQTLAEDSTTRTLCVQFPSEEAAVGHAMLLGTRARVLGPTTFREAIIKRAREMLSVLELNSDGLTTRGLTGENNMVGHEVLGRPENYK